MDRIRRRMRRSPPRALSWLLAFAVALAGLPTITIHQHADAVPGHHHDVEVDHDRESERGILLDHESGGPPSSVLHVHGQDACSTAHAPTVAPTLTLPIGPHQAPDPLLDRRHRSVALLPPTRPPIA